MWEPKSESFFCPNYQNNFMSKNWNLFSAPDFSMVQNLQSEIRKMLDESSRDLPLQNFTLNNTNI